MTSRRTWSVVVVLLLSSLSLLAGPVSEGAARQKAQTFLKERGRNTDALTVNLAKKSRRATATTGSSADYYVFNLGQSDGFVIVSGDDRTTAILGYSDSGSISDDDMPDGLSYLLDGYEQQMAMLDRVGEASRTHRTVARTAIAPLIKSQWDQHAPYNNLCPEISGERSVVGCAATTLAQLMYYHKWPKAACTAIPSYTTTTQDKGKNSITLDVDALSTTTFSWNDMLDSYKSTPGTDEQQQAVATLMRYCGSAIQMRYGLAANGGSSAYSESFAYALKTYFGYDTGIRHCYRKNYSYDAWVDLIYSELADHRPVALGGQSCGGGHSFICDGYDTNDHNGAYGDYFHINWGWSGKSDGYFLLSVLQPWEQGIGGSSTLDGFSYGQDVVIGIQKSTTGTKSYCLLLDKLNLSGENAPLTSKVFTRENGTDDFTGIGIDMSVYCIDYGNNTYDIALQLVDGNGKVLKTYIQAENQPLGWNQSFGSTPDIDIPSKVDDTSVGNGTYYIKAVSRPHGAATWQECHEGNVCKLTATINDNTLTIDVPIPGNTLPGATLSVTGDKQVGHEQTVTATFTCTTGVYNGDVVLRVNGTAIMGKILNIAAGQNVELEFSFIPKQGGTNTLALYTTKTGGTKIGTETNVDITLALTDDANNSSSIEKNNGITTDVVLTGRTLYKDGAWNTLCLPFDVTLANSPLAGDNVQAMVLNNTNSGLSGTTLTLNFTAAPATIPAGTPFIVKWDGDGTNNLVDPEFDNVTIDMTTRNVVFSDGAFMGTYKKTAFTGTNTGILLLGSSNQLYWPENGATLGAQRAYFDLSEDTNVRAFNLIFDDQATGIVEAEANSSLFTLHSSLSAWYTLDGRRLSGKPTKKGIYVNNGRKTVIK